MILPLPSSPHWAPTRIVFAINFLRTAPDIANKNPRTKIRGKAAGSLREEIKDAARSCQFSKTRVPILIKACFQNGWNRFFLSLAPGFRPVTLDCQAVLATSAASHNAKKPLKRLRLTPPMLHGAEARR